MNTNLFLLFAALLSAIAALLHLAIIVGGANWYRFFGAGEKFANAAQAGKLWPHFITLLIAFVLFGWAVYALSGVGVIGALPYLKTVLLAITIIYLVRGAALLPLFIFAPTKVTAFDIWSSLICLGIGVVYALGLAQVWAKL